MGHNFYFFKAFFLFLFFACEFSFYYELALINDYYLYTVRFLYNSPFNFIVLVSSGNKWFFAIQKASICVFNASKSSVYVFMYDKRRSNLAEHDLYFMYLRWFG